MSTTKNKPSGILRIYLLNSYSTAFARPLGYVCPFLLKKNTPQVTPPKQLLYESHHPSMNPTEPIPILDSDLLLWASLGGLRCGTLNNYKDAKESRFICSVKRNFFRIYKDRVYFIDDSKEGNLVSISIQDIITAYNSASPPALPKRPECSCSVRDFDISPRLGLVYSTWLGTVVCQEKSYFLKDNHGKKIRSTVERMCAVSPDRDYMFVLFSVYQKNRDEETFVCTLIKAARASKAMLIPWFKMDGCYSSVARVCFEKDAGNMKAFTYLIAGGESVLSLLLVFKKYRVIKICDIRCYNMGLSDLTISGVGQSKAFGEFRVDYDAIQTKKDKTKHFFSTYRLEF